MVFCSNCGAQLQDGKKFCASCGHPVEEAASQPQGQAYQQQNANKITNFVQNTTDETAGMDAADIEQNKVMGGLAYFLFFLPLIACPQSKYGRFHANQGLLLLILSICGGVLSAVLSAILTWRLGWLSALLSFAIWIVILVVGIIGLINGFTGKAKELPVIGKFRIIK